MMISEEKKNKQKAIGFIILTLIAGVVFFFYGIPALGKFAAFVSEIAKGDKPIDRKDTTPPPPPQIDTLPEFTNTEILKITGKSEEGATVKINFNGTDEEVVADSSGNFSNNLDLKRGENILILSAKDFTGNESVKSKPISVTFDSVSPVMSIESPSDGTSYFGSRQRQIDIKGSVDDSDAKVTINDRFVAVDDNGTFQFTTTLSEGENKFVIKATDLAGNTSEKDLTLNFTL